MKMNKNTIIQILWIVAVGIIIYFIYNGQSAKREAKEHQDAQFATCIHDAWIQAVNITNNAIKKDPSLSSGDFMIEVRQEAYNNFRLKCYEGDSK